MYSETVAIVNPTGLHARPASEFVLEAKKFSSKVFIKPVGGAGDPINAKSMVRLLSIGVAKGAEVEISAEGEDEKQAVAALVALVKSGFGE